MHSSRFQDSLNAGFVSPIPVMSKYEFVDHPKGDSIERVLVDGGKLVGHVYPASIAHLPNILGKVNPNKENEILRFVSRYGLLGGDRLPWTDEFTPESSEWIQSHIKTVRLVLDLLTCIQEEDEKKIVELIRNTEIHVEGSGVERQVPIASLGRIETIGGYFNVDREPYFSAIEVIKTAINGNVASIRRSMSFDEGRFKSYFAHNTLIELVYWQLGNIAEGGELKRCSYCNTPFLSTRTDQKFCSYDPVFEKESRCALAHRQKQYRERKKNEKND